MTILRLWSALLVATYIGSVQMLQYNITKTWNNTDITHAPTMVKLESISSGTGTDDDLKLTVTARFFDDPPPAGEPGEPFFGLWDYEVVEVFFLNDKNEYLEVEVAPGGEHIVLLLNGVRNDIRHSLPLKLTTSFSSDNTTWTGEAIIPRDYLPFDVSKFNAYAIHGIDDDRMYEALYPASEDAENPDFHALEYFQPIDLKTLLSNYPTKSQSQLWTDSLEGIFRYKIQNEWNGVSLSHSSPVEFTLQNKSNDVMLSIEAPFFNDTKPTKPSGSVETMENNEVVGLLFLNGNNDYLDVCVGPYGHYNARLMKEDGKSIKPSLSLSVNITEKVDGVDGKPGIWKGNAIIPGSYFPPNVTKMNAFASHGTTEERIHEALYPAPFNDSNYLQADFLKPELFKAIDIQYLLDDNMEYSNEWDAAMNKANGLGLMSTEVPLTMLEYQITEMWNGARVSHRSINITLENQGEHLLFHVESPKFGSSIPSHKSSNPFLKLWHYEAVAAFFLNDEDQYLEVGIGPGSQHIVVMFSGRSNSIRHSLPLSVNTWIDGDSWRATAIIPQKYIPYNVTMFNAYAVHPVNSDLAGLEFDSLYPAPTTAENPDFHALEYFQPIDLGSIIPEYNNKPQSSFWTDSLSGIFHYSITKEWDGKPSDVPPYEISLQGFQAGVEVNVSAPLFNDPPNPGNTINFGQGCGMTNQEVVEVFFANDKEDYLKIQLGPWGHHRALIFNGRNNRIKKDLPMDYLIVDRQDGAQNEPGLWTGSVLIPPEYFPSNVTKITATAVYGSSPLTKYLSLHQDEEQSTNGQQTYPDFHQPDLFLEIDFKYLVVSNGEHSTLWQDAIKTSIPEPKWSSSLNDCNNEKVFEIERTWNGKMLPIDESIIIKLEPFGDNLLMSIKAPFYDDPAAPGKPGEALLGLWDYEVVEAFFLNDDGQYLEVEIGPRGQHMVLLLNDVRKPVRHSLPLEVETMVAEKYWTATATIPAEYLPENVTKFNAYSIHGVGSNRLYNALYPADKTKTQPDFHALEFFKKIDFEQISPGHRARVQSTLWSEAIIGKFTYKISKLWNDEKSDLPPVEIVMQGFEAGVEINITAPFFNTPPAKHGKSSTTLNDVLEGVEITFVNKLNEHLTIQLDPWGEYDVSMFENPSTKLNINLNLDYFIDFRDDEQRPDNNKEPHRMWKGSALIPPQYFPPNITNMNAVAMHGSAEEGNRVYRVLYPAIAFAQTTHGARLQKPPLQFSKPMDFEYLVTTNRQYSNVWKTAKKHSKKKLTHVVKPVSTEQRVSLRKHDQPSPQHQRRLPRPQEVRPTINKARTKPTSTNLKRLPQLRTTEAPSIIQDELITTESSIIQEPDTTTDAVSSILQPFNGNDKLNSRDDLFIPPELDLNHFPNEDYPTDLDTTLEDPISIIEEVVDSLSGSLPVLPPPHPFCFSEGLVRDPNRCQIFYECALEEGTWRVYDWRCSRGLIFDVKKVACIRGQC